MSLARTRLPTPLLPFTFLFAICYYYYHFFHFMFLLASAVDRSSNIDHNSNNRRGGGRGRRGRDGGEYINTKLGKCFRKKRSGAGLFLFCFHVSFASFEIHERVSWRIPSEKWTRTWKDGDCFIQEMEGYFRRDFWIGSGSSSRILVAIFGIIRDL